MKNKHAVSMVTNFYVVTLFISSLCFGQENILKTNNKESFRNLPDGIIKQEIAIFAKIAYKDSISKTIKLTEYKTYNCSDTHINLNNKKGYRLIHIKADSFETSAHRLIFDKDDKAKLIQIDNKLYWGTNGNIPTMKIAQLSFIHMKSQLLLEPSAFEGLYEPKFCTFVSKRKKIKVNKQTKNITSLYAAVYTSEDEKRVYIHMLNGNKDAPYEVTWIIQEGKYYGRIIDSIL